MGDRVIYKYTVPNLGVEGIVKMPEGAKIVHVEEQGGRACFWAEVDLSKPTEEREFIVRGTGHSIPPRFDYVGTWQDPPFVWHLFVGEIK